MIIILKKEESSFCMLNRIEYDQIFKEVEWYKNQKYTNICLYLANHLLDNKKIVKQLF